MSQIYRIPKKYSDLIQTLSNESVGKIFKNIFGGKEVLDDIEGIYYNLIISDINNIQKQAEGGKKGGAYGSKGGRPLKVWENEEKPLRLEKNNPNIRQDKIKQDKIIKEKEIIKEKDLKENIKDFFLDKDKGKLRMEIYPKELRQDFIKYRTEPFVKGKLKGKPKRIGEKTRSLEGRLDTFLRNKLKDEGTTVAKWKEKCKKKFYL